MAKEKIDEKTVEETNLTEKDSEIEESIAESENDEILKLAYEKANEKKVPLILWQKKDEGKQILVQIISHSDNIVNAWLIGGRKTKSEIQFQIKPSALNSQLTRFGINPNDVFAILYLGEKPSPSNPEFKFKSFVVRKYNPVLQIFITTKALQ